MPGVCTSHVSYINVICINARAQYRSSSCSFAYKGYPGGISSRPGPSPTASGRRFCCPCRIPFYSAQHAGGTCLHAVQRLQLFPSCISIFPTNNASGCGGIIGKALFFSNGFCLASALSHFSFFLCFLCFFDAGPRLSNVCNHFIRRGQNLYFISHFEVRNVQGLSWMHS